jgi:hypothetical protein
MPSGPEDSEPEEGPILSPEELDIADDEHVTEIDDGRYVVSSEARTGDPTGHADVQEGRTEPEVQTPEPDEQSPTDSKLDPPDGQPDKPSGKIDLGEARNHLSETMLESKSRYGFDVTAKFEGAVSQRRMVSNDVATTFESLLLWYAQQIDGTTPVEEVLGILIMESNVPVRYPPESLQNLVETTDLSPEDSIADLLQAVSQDEGVEL